MSIAEAAAPRWGDGEGWVVQGPPLVEIGTVAGDPDYLLAGVTDVVRLESGQIVVADQASSDLRWFSEAGAFVRRTGRAGEGPGDFTGLDFVDVLPGDSVVAYDRWLARIQVFGPEGRLARGVSVRPLTERREARPGAAVGLVDGGGLADGEGLAGGGLVVRFRDFSGDVPSGLVRWPQEVLALVDLADGSSRELVSVPGMEQLVTPDDGGVTMESYLFPRHPVFAAGGGRFAHGDAGTFAIRIAATDDGAVLSLRRDVASEQVTQSHIDAWADGVVAVRFPEGSNPTPEQVARIRDGWSSGPAAERLPLLRSLRFDTEGNLWVEPFHMLGAEPPSHQVFAPDGTWLGSVALPSGLDRGFNPDMAPGLRIGADYVLGVWRDEMDVQRVRLYRLEKPR